MKTVILAGGSGSRLWPLSRNSSPKQFQKLISNKTQLQETISRLSFQKPEDIFISTQKKYYSQVLKQTQGKIPRKNIIIEPYAMDTAPCIGLAASIIEKKHPGSVMAIIYSDHLIQNKKEFKQKLLIAEKLALQENSFNLIEVKANFPNTQLGYVKIGKVLKNINKTPVYSFLKFVEKPDLNKAKKFARSQNYLWNTGLYVWKCSNILQKYKQYLPETYSILKKIAEKFEHKNYSKYLEKEYKNCQKISIDYGIMEKISANEVRVLIADLGWNDIGTWESLYEELSDQNSRTTNVVKALHFGLESEQNLIYGKRNKLIATIGLENFIIVDTDQALLIYPKGKNHKLKELLSEIKKHNPRLL